MKWSCQHTAIVERMAGQYPDEQICAWIEHETGDRFSARTVRRERAAAQIQPCRRRIRLQTRGRLKLAGPIPNQERAR